MKRRTVQNSGLTVFQLLVSIVLIVILGGLWMIVAKRSAPKPEQQAITTSLSAAADSAV
jgi:hypothetical protein